MQRKVEGMHNLSVMLEVLITLISIPPFLLVQIPNSMRGKNKTPLSRLAENFVWRKSEKRRSLVRKPTRCLSPLIIENIKMINMWFLNGKASSL